MADSASAERLDPPGSIDTVDRNLRQALEADTPVEKNYFIRTALQFIEFETE